MGWNWVLKLASGKATKKLGQFMTKRVFNADKRKAPISIVEEEFKDSLYKMYSLEKTKGRGYKRSIPYVNEWKDMQKIMETFDNEVTPLINVLKGYDKMTGTMIQRGAEDRLLSNAMTIFCNADEQGFSFSDFADIVQTDLKLEIDDLKAQVKKVRDGRIAELIDVIKEKNGDFEQVLGELLPELSEFELNNMAESFGYQNWSVVLSVISDVVMVIDAIGAGNKRSYKRTLIKDMFGLDHNMNLKYRTIDGKRVLDDDSFIYEALIDARAPKSKDIIHREIMEDALDYIGGFMKKRNRSKLSDKETDKFILEAMLAYRKKK